MDLIDHSVSGSYSFEHSHNVLHKQHHPNEVNNPMFYEDRPSVGHINL